MADNTKKPLPLSIDVDKVDSAVLKRLIKEVQNETTSGQQAYNRVHNRHNRSTSPRPMPQNPQPE